MWGVDQAIQTMGGLPIAAFFGTPSSGPLPEPSLHTTLVQFLPILGNTHDRWHRLTGHAVPLSKASPRAGALYARVRHFHGPARVPPRTESTLLAHAPAVRRPEGLSRRPSFLSTSWRRERVLKELET